MSDTWCVVCAYGPPAPRGAALTKEREDDVKFVKKAVLVLVVLFCLFYLISRPQDAAGAVRGAVDAVIGAVMAVITFLSSLAA